MIPRKEIQDRIEACLEDLAAEDGRSRKPFNMSDELSSYFEPEELPMFFELICEEFDVDWDDVVDSLNFFFLIESLREELQ